MERIPERTNALEPNPTALGHNVSFDSFPVGPVFNGSRGNKDQHGQSAVKEKAKEAERRAREADSRSSDRNKRIKKP